MKNLRLEQRLLDLARAECANHMRKGNSGKTDYCLQEPPPDHRCRFTGPEGAKCLYFEQSVLPLDAELQALYAADREARAHGDELTERRAAKVVAAVRVEVTCEKCGKKFVPNSNRQRYCEGCRRTIRNAQTRARMQQRRTGNG